MTLLETERLVRKISDLLKQAGSPEIAPKLAEDFAAACHAANLRLQQCEAMIKAGDRHQAIQLAETAPNLLDLVTALEFRESDAWRTFCQQNSLPAAERIDARSVHALNECYAQGITTDHPLYAAYRRAVLSRNDEEALKALQSIVRLNPSDANGASELARLDAKVLAAKMQHLGDLLTGGDASVVVSQIESIESFGFKSQPDGEVWRKAQTIRCGRLLEEATKLRTSSRWLDAVGNLDFIRRLQKEFQVELPQAELKQIEGLEAWAREEKENDRKERDFQSLLAELRYRILQSEEKDTSARYVKLPELRNDYETLHKVWRALEDFARPIPEDATAAFRKRSALLEAEIARRTAIRRRSITAGTLVVLVLGVFAVWVVVGRMKTRDFARQLQEAVAQRQVGAAERLLEHARTVAAPSSGDLGAAVAAAGTFVTREHALQANFEEAFAKLPKELTGEPNASRVSAIADQLAVSRSALDALAPDMKTENEPRLQAFEVQWQKFLSESTPVVNGLLAQWIAAAETESGELDYQSPPEKSAAQLAALSVLVDKIADCESGFTNHLALRSDLLERSLAVRARFAAFDRELKKLDQGMDLLRKARSDADFSGGINLIASSEFSSSAPAVAALAVQSLNANEESTLRILLGATNPATWAFIVKQGSPGFIPDSVMPAEKSILSEFNHDPAISANHRHVKLWLDQEETKSVEWITVGGFDSTVGWKKIKALSMPGAVRMAVFEDRDYGYFDGQYRLSPTEVVYRIEPLDTPHETACFYDVGLDQAWSGGDSYGKPLLDVLDSLKGSQEGSPLFRAYLFSSLVNLMGLQPDAWGLSFCPAARSHQAQISHILGEPLNDGDWFVAGKVRAYDGKLDQFFASVASVSYSKQANGLLSLARAASQSGLHYIGFVGLDGKPNLTENSDPTELWGYSLANRQPVLMVPRNASDSSLTPQPLPLSPLFALPSPCRDYLTQAGVVPDDPSFRGVLPVLFREPTQKRP